MKVGIVCPYSLDVPGGVQSHVLELAQFLKFQGHKVQVIAPSSGDNRFPDYVSSSGKALAFPYNGSTVRVQFGRSALTKLRRWIREGEFDVLHVHEPGAPSLSFLAVKIAQGPIVATFHAAAAQSMMLKAFRALLTPYYEKISGRIAVSSLSRRLQMQSIGVGSVEIPNGLFVRDFREEKYLPGYPRQGATLLFLGRYDEPRKGFATIAQALPLLVEKHPDLVVLVVGPGDQRRARELAGEFSHHLHFLGHVSRDAKVAALRSADVLCAPNTGSESQGIVLLEAMASGTAVAASDLEAFRRVLGIGENGEGRAGLLLPIGNATAWAEGISSLLINESQRKFYTDAGLQKVQAYDWSVIAKQVVQVYETVTVGSLGVTLLES